MGKQILLWVAFNIFILAMLALDLGFFHRKAHAIKIKEALVWSGVWIALALLFNLGIYFWRGPETALEFLTGYLIEKSLSVDNIFVFLLIFSYFGVPSLYQHKVLFWGILGALIMRAVFIVAGIALIEKFHWTIYIFGAFLILIGIKMALQKERKIRPERNPALKLFRRWVPVTEEYVEGKFFVKRLGHYVATPLLIVLIVVETTDIIFAVDSIPAILAITLDLYRLHVECLRHIGIAGALLCVGWSHGTFHHLHYGLSAVLVFVGIKMLLTDLYKIPVSMALSVVAGILLISVMTSILDKKKEK
jgi:tellurite resistance protein TerC